MMRLLVFYLGGSLVLFEFLVMCQQSSKSLEWDGGDLLP